MTGALRTCDLVVDIVFADRPLHRQALHFLQRLRIVHHQRTVHLPHRNQRVAAVARELDVRRGLARRRRHARHDIELVLVDDLQRVVCGTLETLPLLAFKAGLTPPTLIIVGKVVQLRDGDVIHR